MLSNSVYVQIPIIYPDMCVVIAVLAHNGYTPKMCQKSAGMGQLAVLFKGQLFQKDLWYP